MEVAFLSREEFPSYREDVASLIESELSSHCKIHFFARSLDYSNEKGNDKVSYHFSKAFSKNGRANKFNRVSQLWLLIKFSFYMVLNRNATAIVRDDPLSGMFVLFMSKIFGFRFCYWVSFLNGEMQLDDARRRKSKIRKALAEITLSLENYVFKRAENIVFQSEPMKDYFQKRFSRTFNSISIPMGANFSNAENFISRGVDRESNLISYIGSLDLSRNLDFVIDTFSLVKEVIPDARLMLIGGSVKKDSVDKVHHYIEMKGLSTSISITGHLEREKAWGLLSKSAVSISYVPRNTFFDVSSPTKFVESIALSVPVVASDIPDQKLFANQLGLDSFVVKNDAKLFSSKIIETIKSGYTFSEETIRVARNKRDYRFLGVALYQFLDGIKL